MDARRRLHRLDSPDVTVEFFAGFRDAQAKTKLGWQFAGPLGLIDRTGRTEKVAVFMDGIAGVRGRVQIGHEGWCANYYADAGDGSAASTWQLSASARLLALLG